MKWEYKIEAIYIGMGGVMTETAAGILNEFGQEGWEAVSWWHNPDKCMDTNNNDTFVLFKRPISK
jgi:hypothetical protein